MAVDEQGLGPLERGRGRYQRKDYFGALEAFTQAINESSGFLLLNALDHRAAAYEKLDKLQPALKDSKRMIDLKPELSKGYLRCGKVLQLKGENELALKIYERGLNKVKIGTDEQRALLQKMFNKLRAVQSPGRVCDPLEFLPLELAQMVCQYLSMRDRVVCLAVSPSWKKVLESMHTLWTTLDTTSTRKPLNQQSLKSYLKRSNYTVDHAIISTKAAFDSFKLSYLTRTCKNIKTLEMRGDGVMHSSLTAMLPDARQLQTLSVSRGIEVPIATVDIALRTCQKTLQHVSFQCIRGGHSLLGKDCKFEALQSIELRPSGKTWLDWALLQEATPNVIRVSLANWAFSTITIDATSWTKLEYLKLSDMRIDSFPMLPPTLKHLYLDGHYQLSLEPTETGPDLPLLETLSIQHSVNLKPSSVFDIIKSSNQKGNLKTLDLRGRLHAANAKVTDEYLPSTSLESLGLGRLMIGDKIIIAIVDLYPNLKEIDLEETKVTGVGLKYLVNRGIKSINVNHCGDLGEDAVVWAKTQGVEVLHNMMRPTQPRKYRDLVADYY